MGNCIRVTVDPESPNIEAPESAVSEEKAIIVETIPTSELHKDPLFCFVSTKSQAPLFDYSDFATLLFAMALVYDKLDDEIKMYPNDPYLHRAKDALSLPRSFVDKHRETLNKCYTSKKKKSGNLMRGMLFWEFVLERLLGVA